MIGEVLKELNTEKCTIILIKISSRHLAAHAMWLESRSRLIDPS
jgi:hypothetical protein